MFSTRKSQSLYYENPFSLPDDNFHNEIPPPLSSGESLQNQIIWSHVANLDSFFNKIYIYHQKHGFLCMIIEEFLESLQFIFIIILSFFMIQCINYSHIFKINGLFAETSFALNKNVTYNNDIYVPLSVCAKNYFKNPRNLFWIACLSVASMFLVFRIINLSKHIFQYLRIRAFYENILQIKSQDIPYVSWQTVADRLKFIHTCGYRLSIHATSLNDSDILHRILRFQNYLTALVGYGETGVAKNSQPFKTVITSNKFELMTPVLSSQYQNQKEDTSEIDDEVGDILPLNINVPWFGEIYALNQGLLYNLELIFFRAPCSIFRTNWQIDETFKKDSARVECAQRLKRRIQFFALLNLALSPIIFIWQILYYFFTYTQSIKNDPGQALGSRIWSPYADLYFRHYNELDHELRLRLARAYPYANKFVASFGSRLAVLLAKFGVFFSGSLIALALLLSALVAVQQFQNQQNYTTSTATTTITIITTPSPKLLDKSSTNPLPAPPSSPSSNSQQNRGDSHTIASDRASTLLTLITVLGVIYGACRSVAGPEDDSETSLFNTTNLVSSTEYVPMSRKTLLAKILAHVHYLPANWFIDYYAPIPPGNVCQNRHIVPEWDSERVRDIFCTRFFELKFTHFLIETLGPIINPWILFTKIAPKSQEIVDFFRNNTITLEGVGDVCSFAHSYAVESARIRGDDAIQTKDATGIKADTDNQNKKILVGNLNISYETGESSGEEGEKGVNNNDILPQGHAKSQNLEDYSLPQLEELPEISIHESGKNVTSMITQNPTSKNNQPNSDLLDGGPLGFRQNEKDFGQSSQLHINNARNMAATKSFHRRNIDFYKSRLGTTSLITNKCYSPVIGKAELSALNFAASRFKTKNLHENQGDVINTRNTMSTKQNISLKNNNLDESTPEAHDSEKSSLFQSLMTMSTMGGGYSLVSRNILSNIRDVEHLENNYDLLHSINPNAKETCNPNERYLLQNSLPPLINSTIFGNSIAENVKNNNAHSKPYTELSLNCVPHGCSNYMAMSTIDMSLSVLYFYNVFSRGLHDKQLSRESLHNISKQNQFNPSACNNSLNIANYSRGLLDNSLTNHTLAMIKSLPEYLMQKILQLTTSTTSNLIDRSLLNSFSSSRPFMSGISSSNIVDSHNYQTFTDDAVDKIQNPDATLEQGQEGLVIFAGRNALERSMQSMISQRNQGNLAKYKKDLQFSVNHSSTSSLNIKDNEECNNEKLPLLMKSFYPA